MSRYLPLAAAAVLLHTSTTLLVAAFSPSTTSLHVLPLVKHPETKLGYLHDVLFDVNSDIDLNYSKLSLSGLTPSAYKLIGDARYSLLENVAKVVRSEGEVVGVVADVMDTDDLSNNPRAPWRAQLGSTVGGGLSAAKYLTVAGAVAAAAMSNNQNPDIYYLPIGGEMVHREVSSSSLRAQLIDEFIDKFPPLSNKNKNKVFSYASDIVGDDDIVSAEAFLFAKDTMYHLNVDYKLIPSKPFFDFFPDADKISHRLLGQWTPPNMPNLTYSAPKNGKTYKYKPGEAVVRYLLSHK